MISGPGCLVPGVLVISDRGPGGCQLPILVFYFLLKFANLLDKPVADCFSGFCVTNVTSGFFANLLDKSYAGLYGVFCKQKRPGLQGFLGAENF